MGHAEIEHSGTSSRQPCRSRCIDQTLQCQRWLPAGSRLGVNNNDSNNRIGVHLIQQGPVVGLEPLSRGNLHLWHA